MGLKGKLKGAIKGTKNLIAESDDFLDNSKTVNSVARGLGSGLGTWANQIAAAPAGLAYRGYLDDEGQYQIKRNLWGKDVLGNLGSHLNAQEAAGYDTGGRQKGFGLDSITNTIKATNRIGKAFQEDKETPEWVKTSVGLGADPTTYVGVGAMGKIGTKLGKPGLLLQGSKNPVGALLEGPGSLRKIAGLTAGMSAASEISSRTGNKYDDYLLPLVGGGIGMKAAGGKDVLSNSVIRSKNGDVFRDLGTHIENEKTLPTVAPGSQWKSVLKAKGVTEKEMAWNGLDEEFLNRNKISKQDVLNRIKENNFDIEERILDSNLSRNSPISPDGG